MLAHDFKIQKNNVKYKVRMHTLFDIVKIEALLESHFGRFHIHLKKNLHFLRKQQKPIEKKMLSGEKIFRNKYSLPKMSYLLNSVISQFWAP